MNMQTIRLKAPAKINLCLKVGPLRADGFHYVDTVMLAINMVDTIILRSAGKLRLTCRPETLSSGPDNLVWKAAELLRKSYNFRGGVHIYLKKGIPWGAGLGGGSSDAATVLKGLNRLWGLRASKAELEVIAKKLGSDVPFFLDGGLARCTGRGERVNILPYKTIRDLWFVIWNPGIILPTPAVYRALDEIRTSDEYQKDNNLTNIQNEVNLFVRSLLEGTFDLKRGLSKNDLEIAALHISAEMRLWRERLSACLNARIHMSGSGSSFFVVATDEEEAKELRLAAIRGFPSAVGKIARPFHDRE